MPPIKVTHPSGQSILYHEFNGRYFPTVPFHDLDLSFPAVLGLPCREDDVTVLSYPKTGTHWTVAILCRVMDENIKPGSATHLKRGGMIEIQPTAAINGLTSPRALNTHLLPDMIPAELITKKTKFIYVTRNPKDTFVSFYFHCKKIEPYQCTYDWNSYLDMALEGKVDYGSWFNYTKQWETFFVEHPEVPVLKLVYEDMKKDLGAAVDKMAAFMNKPLTNDRRREIVSACDFSSMKSANKADEIVKVFAHGDEHPMFRKGTIGDWKNYFTVAQNERFDEEYRKQMDGYKFGFEQYM